MERPNEAHKMPTGEKLERKPEQSKVFEYSSKLLERPIKPGEPGHDKIFILGNEVTREESGLWVVRMDQSTPTVALNADIRNEFGLNIPLVNEIRENQHSELILLSGGSFVWLIANGEKKLVLLRRDENAPVDAGSLTGPAGRCGEPPSQTSVAETNEEIIIVKSKLTSGGSHYKLLGFYRDEADKDQIVSNKLRQVESRFNDLIKRGEVDAASLLRLIRGEEDVEMLNINDYKIKSSLASERIETRIQGETGETVVDTIENGNVYFDRANNTLEIREIFEVEIPERDDIALILDGEPFFRGVNMVSSLEELKNEKLVPSLRNYVETSTS